MKLLIFPQYAYPANHAVVNQVYEQLLPARGHEVHMIRPMEGLVAPAFVDPVWRGGSMVAYPDEPVGNPFGNFARLLRKRRWIRESIRKLEGTPLDAILVRNDLTSAFAAAREARRRSIPFVYQISSPDAEFMVSRGQDASGVGGLYRRLRGRAGRAMRRSASRRADAVLAISDAMREYLAQTDGLNPARIFSFPMGVPEGTRAGREQIESLRRRLDLPAGKTIVYCGTLDPVRQPDWMIDVLSLVRERVAGAVLLVVTYQTDERRRAFEEEVRRRGADVRVVGPVAFSDVDMYLRCGDVMISPWPPRPEHWMASPTKSLEGLRAGLPVVGSVDVAEHQSLLEASGGGMTVPWNRAAFAAAIAGLLEDPEQRRAMGARGAQWVVTHRAYPRLTEHLERILMAAGSIASLLELANSP